MAIDTPPQCQAKNCSPFQDHVFAPGKLKMDDVLAQTAKTIVNRASAQVDFSRLEIETIRRFKRIKAEVGVRRERWFFKRVLWPAVAMAAMLAIMMNISQEWNGMDPEPSAIVTSFSGEVNEILIMETPGLKQTVIWYQEPGDDDSPLMESSEGGVQSS